MPPKTPRWPGASLRIWAAGIEVWLDKTVLRSGDAWDQKIRREIRDCTLFIAVISRHTEARTEGYFRLEWHLADQRTHLMAKSRPFLIPVCIDETPEEHAEVPESFSLVHWTRLPAGETPTAFVERVLQLLSAAHHHPIPHAAPDATLPAAIDSARALTGKLRWAVIVSGSTLILVGAMLWLAANRGYFWRDPLANAQFSRVTDWSGTEQAAAISRDGKRVAFIADHGGTNDVWITYGALVRAAQTSSS